MIIAIDGPSGTGKSTVAREVARRLQFTFFDTGSMYRSIAWWLNEQRVDPEDRGAVAQCLPSFQYEIESSARGDKRYFVQGNDVTALIRTPEISSLASKIAVYPEVRHAMVAIQRKLGLKGDAVFEGRDMGTVVFPDAELKIFLTAGSKVRAKRRYDELCAKFPERANAFDLDRISREIEERDRNDSTRAISPLKQASDAILIDTSDLSVADVVEKILFLVLERKKYPPMKLSYKVVYWFARIFFKLFFRLKIYGLEHYREGAGILAANHASNYDPPVLSISCPEEVHFLAKGSLFRVPLLGSLIRMLNSHPVSGTATDAGTFRQIIQLLQGGHKVILFPEGTRSMDGELKPLERGMAFIAQRAKCPVFPAYIQGTFSIWPRGKKLPKLFGKIAVIFGPPIEWSEFERMDKREAEQLLTERTAESFRHLKAKLEKTLK